MCEIYGNGMRVAFIICFVFLLNFNVRIASGIVLYNGPIGGEKSILDSINGTRKKYSDLDITPSEIIIRESYPAENHVVLTEDGYLLTIHRIPGPPGSAPVLMQHGLGGSSFDYVVNGKDKALGFQLADQGYDVWMANARGAKYSMCHVKYTSSQYKFWNFRACFKKVLAFLWSGTSNIYNTQPA